MPTTRDENLLEALLDSWDRNNAILVNLLRVVGGVTTLLIGGTVRPLAGFKVAWLKMKKWIYSTVPLSSRIGVCRSGFESKHADSVLNGPPLPWKAWTARRNLVSRPIQQV
jgi:hypothetical protein